MRRAHYARPRRGPCRLGRVGDGVAEVVALYARDIATAIGAGTRAVAIGSWTTASSWIAAKQVGSAVIVPMRRGTACDA